MRRRILPGILGLFVALSIQTVVFAGQKVDYFFDVMSPVNVSQGVGKAMSTGTVYLESFVKSLDTDATREEIEAVGGLVKIVTGNIITASIPEWAIEEIADLEEVVYIEAAKPINVRNDLALTEINANEVHDGLLLPKPYKGKDTIIGIIDTGIDMSHADFRDESGNNRILFIWDQNYEGGTGPAEITSPYGTECTNSQIVGGRCHMRDDSGHGTHVAGIAAGRHDKYGGVAPESSIIVVKYKSELEISEGYADPIFSTTICEAAYYVFEKAKKLGRPAVVNLSLGTHIGPHDGTSLFEECLDSLVEGQTGRALVAAVGNENSEDDYYTGLHAGYSVSDSMKATNFKMRNFAAGRVAYIDIWQSAGSRLNFGLAINNDKMALISNSGMISPGTSKSGHFLGGKIAYHINATEMTSPLNGKPHVGISITFRDDVADPADYSFDLLVSGKGDFNAWLYPDKPADTINFTSYSESRRGVSWSYVEGDRQMSIAVPATAKGVIAVAAYTTRNKWDCCQVSYGIGEILDFSSRGPTADAQYTGHKPEISAPGAMIASAKSAQSPIDANLMMSDGKHILMAGSSMSAPFVSGTIALIFEVNPDFTSEDAKRFIIESAYVDASVGSAPNDIWGYGKLDVLGAIETAFGREPSGGYNSDVDVGIPSEEGASSSSGSCQIIKGQCTRFDSLTIIVITACIGLILSIRLVSTRCRNRD